MTELRSASSAAQQAPTTAELRVPDVTAEPAVAGVPTALDFPDCRACQMWEDAGASWPRPCKQHYGGEPFDSHTDV